MEATVAQTNAAGSIFKRLNTVFLCPMRWPESSPGAVAGAKGNVDRSLHFEGLPKYSAVTSVRGKIVREKLRHLSAVNFLSCPAPKYSSWIGN